MKNTSNTKFQYIWNNIYIADNTDLTPRQEDYYKHSHYRYELYIFLNGNASFTEESHCYELQPGVVILIPPFHYHFVTVNSSSTPYHRIIFNFDSNIIYPELNPFIQSEHHPYIWDCDEHGLLLTRFESNINRYSNSDAALASQILLNSLLLSFKYSIQNSQKIKKINPTISEILKFINNHIFEPLSLNTIASNLYLNPSYISHLFSSNMKIGLMEYIKQKKINMAIELIEHGTSPTDASMKVGFNDYSTFYRLYKKYTNNLPSKQIKPV